MSLKALDLSHSHGDQTLFDGLSLTLPAGRRAGLVGPNGAGKTTLLRILGGRLAPARGSVSLAPGDRIGYLPQEPPGPELTLARLLGSAAEPWEVDAARRGLDIMHLPLDAPLGELSGGEAARALLTGVLLAEPTVLLLDEPTNHLDLDGLAWLEGFLAGFAGSVLVVSHDRRFLDATVSQVLELDAGELVAYEGGYTAYRDEKARGRARLALDYEAQQKRVRRLEADIQATRGFALRTERTASGLGADKQKRYAKKVAQKAQSRQRRLRRELESEEHIDKPRRTGRLKVTLERSGDEGSARGRRSAGGRLVARLRGVDAGWEAPVLHGVDLAVHGGDRIAVTGPNGAGKTTLLALLEGTLAPTRGEVERPVAAAVLPQGPALPADVPAAAFVRERSGAGEGEARRLLGHFGLEGEAALRPLGRLSPGERSRVAVAAMVAAKAEVLLLDEPTNHLDFASLEVLEQALCEYPGAVVAASHDRAFLDGIGVSRRLEVRDGVVSER